MELPSKLLEQIAYNTRDKIEEHILDVRDIPTREEHLSQPLQTKIEQFVIAITFLTGYNGVFNVTNSNIKFNFKKTITDEDGFIQISIPQGAYEIENLSKEIRRIITDKEYYPEANYPLTITTNFSTLGSIIENSPQGPLVSFMFADNIRDLLGFMARTLYGEYNLSLNPVDILSIDNIFLECNIAQGMSFRGRKTGIFQNFATDVIPVYKYIEKFRDVVQWYMMESKDNISTVCFKMKNETNQLVSFNGQSITFRLSIQEIYPSI